jgi:hypothetical protein
MDTVPPLASGGASPVSLRVGDGALLQTSGPTLPNVLCALSTPFVSAAAPAKSCRIHAESRLPILKRQFGGVHPNNRSWPIDEITEEPVCLGAEQPLSAAQRHAHKWCATR